MRPFRAFLAALLIGLAALSAAPVLAGVEQAPRRGYPAWSIQAPDGFRIEHDTDETLTLTAPDFEGAVVLKMFEASDADDQPLSRLAEVFSTALGGEAVVAEGAVDVGGMAGERYRTRALYRAGDFFADVQVYLVSVDPTHVAIMLVVTGQDLTIAQRAVLEDTVRSARIARART